VHGRPAALRRHGAARARAVAAGARPYPGGNTYPSCCHHSAAKLRVNLMSRDRKLYQPQEDDREVA